MKRKGSTRKFWAILTSFNVLTIIYPVASLIQADSDAGQLLSAVVVVSALFMLGLIDIVAILIAYSV